MKKSISFILCLSLIICSFSFCFASPTSWDTSDQANLRAIKNLLDSGGGIYNMISTISSTTNTISNNLNIIKGYLFDNGHSIAYWVNAISTWMSPIYNSITAIPVDISTIIGALGYNDSNSTYHPYLNDIYSKIEPFFNTLNGSFTYRYITIGNDGTYTVVSDSKTGANAMITSLMAINASQAQIFNREFNTRDKGYNLTQNALSWADLNSTYTFTPQSSTDGLYKWLATLQAPVARLSYVLASDERIEAQEASAANEQAVVDNFIYSNGSGSASVSDFEDIASFSDGYKSTFASDASPTAIFTIFSSDHMGWFSQETKNQLDTTSNNNRSKSSNSSTPLLDKQIDEIYNALGVNNND